jgi:hypothetical protein
MKNNILTLVVGFGLIIWASIPLGDKPVNVNYQITASAIGIVVCCAAFSMIGIEQIRKHIDEKLKK